MSLDEPGPGTLRAGNEAFPIRRPGTQEPPMLNLAPTVLYLACIGPCLIPPGADDRPRPAIEGWGDVIDPEGDCRVGLEKGTLTIAVPATSHDLSVEAGNMKAPRVLRGVDGDFIA